MGKSLKYVKDFDFKEKPCNYSCGGSVDKYAKGGRTKSAAVRRRVPVAPPQPALNRLAAAAQQAPMMPPQGAPMGLKKGGTPARMRKNKA